ncbi:diguanylate cyclase domain-containing protein [Blastomonas sp.]|uniref:diguanylate cyclase domain-containing protein n=1 Tax=Blastomonas sp. TaxID=1909299 RepID=UPI003593C2C4
MQIDPDQNAELMAMQQLIGRDILLPLFENSSSFIIVLDAATLRIVAANRPVRDMLGLNMRGLQRLYLSDALPDLPPGRVNRVLQRFNGLRRPRVRLRLALRRRQDMILDVDIMRMAGRVPSIVVQAQDMTNTLNALRQADNAEARLTTAIDALSDGFALFDAADRLVICNDTFRTFYPASAAVMQPGIMFVDILRAGLQKGQYAAAIGKEAAWLHDRMDRHLNNPGAIEQKLSNGRWLRIVERRTVDDGRVGLWVDITTLKEQQDALRRLAVTDELTGLRNRRNLLEDISLLLDGLPPQRSVVVFHLDLDRFKAVNDVYGHLAGDHVLKHCAAVLESAVPPGDFAARVGGDEFIVVRRMPSDQAQINDFANEIIKRMMEPISYAGQFLHIGASVGVALLDVGIGMGARGTVLTAADLALYEAKKLGGMAVFYETGMLDDVMAQNALARELQTALERHEFEAYFQPQIDVARGSCIGFEALLRWKHPRRGVLSAGVFLAIAQRAGLTDALDTLMMDEACQCLRWLAEQGRPDISVSIRAPRKIALTLPLGYDA